ncbi:MAG: ankyrin repeat domain-containing protein, partial [Rhodospirillaceae bacterium]
VNTLNWTAVIESIVLGDVGPRHAATLKALVYAGADPNIPDAGGNTPLTLASQRGYAEMVAILEDIGAKP